MLIFTQQQIKELLDIIQTQQAMFVGANISSKYLSTEDKSLLKNAGVDYTQWENKLGYIDEAFSFGILAQAISDDRIKSMDYYDFKRFVRAKNFIPLTVVEKAAIDHLKYQAFSDITSLGGKIRDNVNQLIIDKDKGYRARFNKILQDATIKTVELRGSVKDIISEIGNKTQDWSRNLGRIAEYNLHNAYEEGRASAIERQFGEDALVYKDVYPGACKHCIKFYLTGGMGSEPILFNLEDLRGYGSNVGLKVAEWTATLGPLHPYCRCTLEYLPKGFVWDDDKGRFIRPKKTVNTGDKKKTRPKVTIKIGGEEYKV